MTKKILKTTALTCFILFFLWFLFLPQFYRFAYALLIISALSAITLAVLNRKEIGLWFKDKKSLMSLNALISVIVVLLIASGLNYIANNNDKKLDLTRAKVNTISNQTIKILKSLNKEIHFIAFLDPAIEGVSFKYAIEKYSYYTNKISYEIVDPDKDPIKARNYNIVKYGTIIATLNGNEVRFESLTEEDLTNSIIRLSRNTKKKIYFLSGHGERSIASDDASDYSILKKTMTGQGYTVENLNLLSNSGVPSDTNLLIIAGANKAFFDKEVKVIQEYIDRNGPVFILSDPSMPNTTINANNNVNKIISALGLRLRNDVIVDPQSKLFGVTEAMPVVQLYDKNNPITSNFNEATIYPFAQSVDASKVNKSKFDLIELCKTGNSSWGETEAKEGKISFNKDRDYRGPLDLCVLLSDKKDKDIAVFGNSSFVSNQYISHAANSDLFMNTVSYLVKDNDLISIRPKIDEAGKFMMPGGLMVGMVVVYVIPFSILSGGLVYWYKRRKK
ncbi:MAG: Gldg family protein [bacterium]